MTVRSRSKSTAKTCMLAGVLLLAGASAAVPVRAFQAQSGQSAPSSPPAGVVAPAVKPAAPPAVKPAVPPAVPAGVAPPSAYVIGPDDVLAIVFWRDKDMSADVIV